jgi:peptidyl-prolyl cis-trans isomerase A (cyclophilin A)
MYKRILDLWPSLATTLLVALGALFPSLPAQAQEDRFVCMETSLGTFCIEMLPQAAPQNVNNFLNYVKGGDFDGTFIHRSVPGFVIQAGGYFYSPASEDQAARMVEIPKDPPVVNEFNRSNLRGTVAMAKFGGDPNSATSEWFVNLANNAEILDPQNGGFTVFGEVVGNGMMILDAIAARIIRNFANDFGGAFETLPMLKFELAFNPDDLILIKRAYVVSDPEDIPVSVLPAGTGFFDGLSLTVPMQYRDTLYRVIFDLTSTDPNLVVRLRTNQIIQLVDREQERAVFDNNRLTIPSVLYGTQLFLNVVLEMSDPQTFSMTLTSYELPPEPEPEEEEQQEAETP